jgi:type IV pilus assembly protein PilC
MEFKYKARDAQGGVVEGVIESPDRLSAAKDLRAQQLLPVSINSATEQKKSLGAIQIFPAKIKLREKIVFTHNLSGMLTAGLSLYRAIEVMQKQNKNPALSKVLEGLLSTVNSGGTFSDALAKYPKVFSTLFVSMVRAGEESGNLATSLKEVGTSLEKAYNLNRKIKGAMMYPSIIVIAIIIIGILMLVFVVPTLTKVFKDFGTELPASTKFIIAVSDAAANHPIILLVSMATISAGLWFLFNAKRMQHTKDTIVLRLPVIGEIVKEVNAARTARTLSSLLASGVEMTRALSITQEVLQNGYYKEVLARAGVAVQKGEALSTIFKAETKLYPIMLGEMMAVGEETGALTSMLNDVAIFYEEEVDEKTKDLSTIIEPVLMVFIGGAVGFFAVSMIQPMYGLVSGFGG